MQKLVLSSLGVICLSTLVAACGSSSPDQGKPADNGTAGATSGSGGSGGGGGTGGGTTNEPYPAGPYGADQGSVMADYTFLGWDNPAAANFDPSTFKQLTFGQFYNPGGTDATKPKLLWINVSARWCSVCKSEYLDLKNNDTYSTYKAKGVEFIGVLFEDANESNPGPASPADVQWWTQTFAVSFPFVIDPGFKMSTYFNADATPLNMVVDAKTMQIKYKVTGYDPTMWSTIDSLLAGG